MSFRKKLSLLLTLLFLLLLLYFSGEGLTQKGRTEERSHSLFSPEECASIEEIEIPLTHTYLEKEEGQWYLRGTVDGSPYRADEEAVDAFLRKLEEAKTYAQHSLGSGGWKEYFSSTDVKVALSAKAAEGASSENTPGASSGNASGKAYSTFIRIGDRVPGTKRRYVTKGDEKVYETDDLLDAVIVTHRAWADLSLFEEEFTHSDLIAAELEFENEPEIQIETVEGRIHTIRLERTVLQDRSGTGGWTGFIGGAAVHDSFTPEKNKVERLTDTLMSIKVDEYLGRRGSESIESLLHTLVMHITLEHGGGSIETLEIYKTLKGDHAVISSNRKDEGLPDKAVFFLPEEIKNRIIHGVSQLLK